MKGYEGMIPSERYLSISQVIAQLEAIKAEHGDIKTAAYCGTSEDGNMLASVIVEEFDNQTLYYKGDDIFQLGCWHKHGIYTGDKVVVFVSR